MLTLRYNDRERSKTKVPSCFQDAAWLLFRTGNTPCSLVWQRSAQAVFLPHIVGSYSFHSTGVQSLPACNRREKTMNKYVRRSFTIKAQCSDRSKHACSERTECLACGVSQEPFIETTSHSTSCFHGSSAMTTQVPATQKAWWKTIHGEGGRDRHAHTLHTYHSGLMSVHVRM